MGVLKGDDLETVPSWIRSVSDGEEKTWGPGKAGKSGEMQMNEKKRIWWGVYFTLGDRQIIIIIIIFKKLGEEVKLCDVVFKSKTHLELCEVNKPI